MPQIWLDDDELADFAGIGPAHARIYAIQQGWTRMRSRSGRSRSRLPAELMEDYLRFFMQASLAQDSASRSWITLREDLLGLVPGSGFMPSRITSQQSSEDAKSGHSLTETVLVLHSRQNEAA